MQDLLLKPFLKEKVKLTSFDKERHGSVFWSQFNLFKREPRPLIRWEERKKIKSVLVHSFLLSEITHFGFTLSIVSLRYS